MVDESANVAGEAVRAALELSVSASTTGFSVSLIIDSTIVAGIVSVGAFSLGAYYLANRRPVDNAIRNGLEIRDEAGVVDPEVRNIEEGSILVELHCHSEHSFIQFVEDFQAKKVEYRLKEEFSKIGFRGKFHVTIRNAKEVSRNVQMIRSSQKERKTKKVEDKEVKKASEAGIWKARGLLPPYSVRRAQSPPPYSEPGKPCSREVHSPPPPYLAPAVQSYSASNGPGRFNYSHGQGSRNIWKQPFIPEVSSQDNPEVVLTEGTLIKDIPYHLCDKIERLLDPPDANHHDWRGMASVMNLNTEEVRQLENAQDNGKMKGLIERMTQRNKTVNDLLGWLRHPDVQRFDVIDEIKKECPNIPNTLLLTEDDESSEHHESDNVKKHFHALLISCSTRNDKEDKKHRTELRNLEGVLEDSWDVVKCQAKCKASNLIQTVHSFLMNREESGKIVSFVYLAGSTVQINGENYLLPSDLKSPSSRADLMHSSLNINWLVKQLSENYMQVVIVDGAHENSVKDLNLTGVLQGMAPIQPPPNGVIAFPCPPGTIRPEQERLAYIKSVVKNLSEESNLMLADLFEKVRADLASQSVSSPVEFSLTSSPLPICVNPQGLQAGLRVDSSEDTTYHAVIVANANYQEGRVVDAQQCMKDREQLRIALLKAGWKVELEACDKPGKDIMEELRKVLNKLADDLKRVVMVYFMGYTKMIMDINYFFGSDFTAFAAEPLRSSVPLQWALDLMCEKLMGKKIMIVDDLTTSRREGLAEMSAPLDVMISLPKGARSDPNASKMQREASFTSNFARLLEAKAGQLPLKEVLKIAARASLDQQLFSSNLFDPK